MSDLMLDVGLANELKMAFRRGDWTNEEIKRLCEGDILKQVRGVVRGLAEVVAKSILDFFTAITLPAQPRFVARDHFKVDTSEAAEVRIGYLGDNFQAWFLNKVEEPVGETKLAIHTLAQASLDQPIREELGDRAEITLSQLWALLKAQGKGEAGSLLTDGCWTITHIPDVSGTLRAVEARWAPLDGDWSVDADSVEDPRRWREGRRVVSRK